MGLIKPISESFILRGLGNFLKKAGAIPQEVEIRRIIEEVVVEQQNQSLQTGLGTAYYQTEDFSASVHKQFQTQSKNLWVKHPIARKALRLRRSFVCNEGFKAESAVGNDKVNEFLAKHEDINWKGKTDERVETLCTLGELAYWIPPVNTVNGHYELGMVKGDLIEELVGSPLNAERAETLKLSQDVYTYVEGERVARREFPIYRYCWLNQHWVGEVLYLGINRLNGMHRGMSDLVPVIDWLRLFDTVCWTEGERLKMLRSFLMHLKIEGANPEEVAKKSKQFREKPIAPGSNYVSNEKETWNAIAPEINTGPVLDYLKFLFGLVAGNLDMPEHFYHSSENVNRASAREMKEPIYAAVRDRKRDFAAFRAAEAQIAVQRAAKIPGSLVYGLSKAEQEVQIVSLTPEREAFEVIGQHLESFSKALVVAESRDWISSEAAAKQFVDAASALGLSSLESGDVPAVTEEALNQLERRRPFLEGVHPLALDGDPDWKISGYPVAV